jgi:hypothetical protein
LTHAVTPTVVTSTAAAPFGVMHASITPAGTMPTLMRIT